ncbi:MAG: major facilitator superfamily 1 [Bryobacterales bacterium]|nr:major facilitator superfamily 1 [Bryobacterales bacterium]
MKAARWGVVAVFALASTWNFLDRGLLAAAAPAISSEFHLSNQDYGWLVSAFGLSYALASPAMGWFMDRVGVQTAILWAVGLWSLATALTGWSSTFVQLISARVFLGIWESAGVPAAGKLNAMYLEPRYRAIGAAVTQVGLSLGSMTAPRLVNVFPAWRTPFLVCAGLGLLWLPLWTFVRRGVPILSADTPRERDSGTWALLRDSRLLRLAAANFLWMGIYSLSSNWTTVFMTTTFRMTATEANNFAWFPPVASTLGAFTGGWISLHLMKRGREAVGARIGGTLVSALGCLTLLMVPLAPSPLWATAAISLSYFWVTAGSVNIYTIPVDIWGSARAGTAISALVFSYGLLQMVISPAIGAIVDRFGGFAPVCRILAFTPLAGWLLLRGIANRSK